MSHSDDHEAAGEADKAEADRERLDGDWSEAQGKARESWGERPGEAALRKPGAGETPMDHTEEGYGTGKDGADPRADHPGETPDKPVV